MVTATTEPVRLPPGSRLPKPFQAIAFWAANHRMFAAVGRRYGSSVISVNLPRNDHAVVISDPVLAKELFKTSTDLLERPTWGAGTFVTRPWDQDDVVFLNWGYEEDPPMGLPLTPSDEPNRYCIQLYHRTATQTDLSGKKVLEVSCGHGGGGAYLIQTLHPASYTGLDFNPDGSHSPKNGTTYRVWISCTATPRTCRSPMSPSTRCSTSKPRTPTRTSTVSSTKWRGCCARAGISCTSISAGSSNMTLGTQRWPACRCGWFRSARSTPTCCAGWITIRGSYLDLVGRRVPVLLQPFGRLFAGAPGTLMYRNCNAGGSRTGCTASSKTEAAEPATFPDTGEPRA